MKINYELLETIHRILQQQSDLNDQLARGPRHVKIAETAEADFKKQVDEAKDQVRQAKMLADEKQLTLKQREAKIDSLKTKLNTCESNREYQLLNEQILADQQANSVQADEILELLEKIDGLDVQHRTAIANLEKAKKETLRIRDEVDQRLAELKSELQRVTKELDSQQAKLPGEVRAEYFRLVAANGPAALSATDGETCGHCCKMLTVQTGNELRLRSAVFCKSCGCLMYLTTNHHTAAS